MRGDGFETVAYALPGDMLNKMARDLKVQGYAVERDSQAGTLIAKLDGKPVLRAMQMGRGRPWMVRAVPGLITKKEP
jgi:hypothetical protein